MQQARPGRTVVRLSIAFVGAIAALGLVWLWQSYRQTLDAAERTARTMTVLLAEHTARTFDAVDRALGAAIQAHELTRGEPPERRAGLLAARLRPILSGTDGLRNISLVDGVGDRIAGGADTDARFNVSDRDYFRAHMGKAPVGNTPDHGGLFIGAPVKSRLDGRWIFTVSRRLDGPGGRFDGVAVAIVDPGYFIGLYHAVELGPARAVALFRRDGVLLARDPVPAEGIGRAFPQVRLFTEALPGAPSGTFTTLSVLDGVNRLLGYASVPGLPLVVVIGMARADVLEPWYREAAAILVPLVLLGGLVAAMGGFAVVQVAEAERQRLALAAAKQQTEAANQALEQANAELHRSMDELNAFAAIVAHDLRAPLANVRGFADELRIAVRALEPAVRRLTPAADGGGGADGAVEESLDRRIPEALGFITESVATMDGRIGAIMQLVRHGRLEPRQDAIDTAALVRTLGRSLAYQLARAGATLEAGDLPVVVSDRRALEQILANLLDNAVKYLAPSRPGRIAVWAEREGRTVAFHVRDNGRGIAARDQERVFQIFQRAGIPDRPGDGMGLAYTRALVRRLGGEITCASAEGEGTLFRFTIIEPAAEPTAAEPTAAEPTAANTA